MSPWQEHQSPRWPLYGGIGCVALAMVIGLLMMMGVFGGGGDDRRGGAGAPAPPSGSATTSTSTTVASPASPSETTSRPTSSAAPAPPGDAPQLVSWGQDAHQLAVLVRNDTAQVIDRAQVRITGRDAAGRRVVSTTSTTGLCCVVVGLQPGQDFGLFAPLKPGAAKVATVTVDYVTNVSRAVGKEEATVTVSGATLERFPDDTVVTATLAARGPVDGYVAVQAMLVGTDGRLSQVISGRYYCYQPGTRRQVRLRLFHAVPAGVRLFKVVAHPIPTAAGAAQGKC